MEFIIESAPVETGQVREWIAGMMNPASQCPVNRPDFTNHIFTISSAENDHFMEI
jgi:hypothetical protein